MNGLPDAILAVTDPVAIGIFSQLRKENIKIPRDAALIGFSDNPVMSPLDPPLTTVRQPAYHIGKPAAELLIQQIENEQFFPDGKILHYELIVRKST